MASAPGLLLDLLSQASSPAGIQPDGCSEPWLNTLDLDGLWVWPTLPCTGQRARSPLERIPVHWAEF